MLMLMPAVLLQTVELKVTAILHLGQIAASAKTYPLAKKKQTMEFLREKMHLRARHVNQPLMMQNNITSSCWVMNFYFHRMSTPHDLSKR